MSSNFDEKMLKVLAMVLAKVADGAEIRLLVRGEKTEGDITFEQAVDFPGATNTLSVGEDQDFEQHYGMKLRSASVFVGFLWVKWLQPVLLVEVVDSVRNKLFETIVFDPLREVLRQQVLLILIVSDEVGRHRWNLTQ